MNYASFTNSVKTRDYRLFCVMMDIRSGPGTVRYRTPAENRTVNQFLLAVNTGRRAVFLNFNRDLAVIVEPRNSESLKDNYGNYRADINLRRAFSRIDLEDSSFEGPSKVLKDCFHENLTKRLEEGVSTCATFARKSEWTAVIDLNGTSENRFSNVSWERVR